MNGYFKCTLIYSFKELIKENVVNDNQVLIFPMNLRKKKQKEKKTKKMIQKKNRLKSTFDGS